MIAESPFVAQAHFTPQKIWTYDEVNALEDAKNYEIYDGELFEMPSPSLLHQDIILKIAALFLIWAAKFGGKPFLSPVDLYINDQKYLIPDLVFYTKQSLENSEVLRDPKRLHIAPDVIVEIVSPSTERNDRVRKVKAYAEFGVKNYWIIDPENKTLEALELRDGIYSIVDSLEDEEQFTPKGFPELVVELRTLWSLEA